MNGIGNIELCINIINIVMCKLEDIHFRFIVGELMVNSRAKKMWELWNKRGFKKCGGFFDFMEKYWIKRFNRDNASKNYICSIWIKFNLESEKKLEEYKKTIDWSKVTEATYETDPHIIEDYCKKKGITVEQYIKQTKEAENYRYNINQGETPVTPDIQKEYPTVTKMAQTFAESIVQWAKKGFKVVTEEEYNQRLDICKACPVWDGSALNGGGRCRECGCATQAKLKIATERCPLDKWVQIER
jgi:hypothetical protein